jgi:hypothetical protein
VELSREVFKALHGIGALQNIHMRMQVGRSIYQAPPAIPVVDVHTSFGIPPPPPWSPANHDISFAQASPSPGANSVAPFGGPFTTETPPIISSHGSTSPSKPHHEEVRSLLPAIQTLPLTLSGFKDLKSLAILDMDTLDYVEETAACIRNSSSTLNTLKLSFSESLANKSRKPPPEVHSDDDSDQEDEFGQLIPPGPPPQISSASDPNGPSKVLKAQEERKRQEAVMGKIFGIGTAAPKPKTVVKHNVEAEVEFDSMIPPLKTKEDNRKIFIRNLVPVASKLLTKVKDTENVSTKASEVLDLIAKASQLYLSGEEILNGDEKKAQVDSTGSSTAKAIPASSSTNGDATESDAIASTEPGLFDELKSNKKAEKADADISNPDDIDVEEPEGHNLAIDADIAPSEIQSEATEEDNKFNIFPPTTQPFDSISLANQVQVLQSYIALRNAYKEIESDSLKLRNRILEIKTRLDGGAPLQESDFQELSAVEAEYRVSNGRLDSLARDLKEANGNVDAIATTIRASQGYLSWRDGESSMSEYIRNTRGLTLSTLSIYLIPLKATILSQAIDLSVLQSITLLNVGPQTPFWNIMARENKISGLPLHKIHIDNVTLPFLVFISQLDNLTELLLVERTQKARVESTAAKSLVTMEQIRRVALKKHAHTLRVLMIRNDAGSDWDLNVKTAMLLCKRAKLLEEMAVSFGIKTMVLFSSAFCSLH